MLLLLRQGLYFVDEKISPTPTSLIHCSDEEMVRIDEKIKGCYASNNRLDSHSLNKSKVMISAWDVLYSIPHPSIATSCISIKTQYQRKPHTLRMTCGWRNCRYLTRGEVWPSVKPTVCQSFSVSCFDNIWCSTTNLPTSLSKLVEHAVISSSQNDNVHFLWMYRRTHAYPAAVYAQYFVKVLGACVNRLKSSFCNQS